MSTRQSVLTILLFIACLAFGLWVIHGFVFPILPGRAPAALVLWISIALGVAAMISGLKDLLDLVHGFRLGKIRKQIPPQRSAHIQAEHLENMHTANVIGGNVSAQNIAGRDIAVHHHHYPRPAEANPIERRVIIGSLSMDEEECDWTLRAETNRVVHRYMPLYMQFIEVNHFVCRYDSLTPDVIRMFEDVLVRLQAVLDEPAALISEEDLSYFHTMRPDTFYKSVVLLNRLGPRLESLPDVYDVRSNFLGDRHLESFFAYDTKAIKCVKRILPLAWEHAWRRFLSEMDSRAGGSMPAFKRIFMRTINPVFDVVLVNNMVTTQVVDHLEVLIEEVWTEIKAGPASQALRALAHYRFVLDFNKQLNRFKLEPPISFGAEQPARLKVEFVDFIASCPGNCANLRFRFVCTDTVAETGILLMDF